MANPNVFGDPITDRGSRSNNADYAKHHEKEGNKFDQAVDYVNNEKASFDGRLSTRCIFYNATGETLKTTPADHSYDGKIYDSYPLEVQNGQWGAFLHVGIKTPCQEDTGSKAYVSYRVKASNGLDFCKTLIGWGTPLNTNSDTHAFCAVRDDGYVINNDVISEEINTAEKETSSTFGGITMSARIEAGVTPLLIVRFHLN